MENYDRQQETEREGEATEIAKLIDKTLDANLLINTFRLASHRNY